jgi:hypothetical protein
MNFESLSNGTVKNIVRDGDVRSDEFADTKTRLLDLRHSNAREIKIILSHTFASPCYGVRYKRLDFRQEELEVLVVVTLKLVQT